MVVLFDIIGIIIVIVLACVLEHCQNERKYNTQEQQDYMRK